MYQVIYLTGDTVLIPDDKATRILLLHKQNMLSVRQRQWMTTVKDIVQLRQAPSHRLLNKTKDMVCNCIECSPLLR